MEELHMQTIEMQEKLFSNHNTINNASNPALPTTDELSILKEDYTHLLKAVIDLLDGAKYLWVGEEHK